MKPYFTYGTSASNRDLVTSTVNYEGKLKRYFSSLDAEIFIGGERIIDINRIDYSYEEKKLPIYGFNSFMPSRIIVGQKIIQGTFVINFTEVGYIANLLESIDESEIANPWDKVGQSCDPNNAALFKKSFDILIGYGGYNVPHEASFRNTYQTLRGVHINGYQQILDISGEPIYEVYSFIARDLHFNKKTETISATEPKEEVVVKDDYVLTDTIDKVTETPSTIIADIKHVLLDNMLSTAEVRFTKLPDQIDIKNARLVISDNKPNISKSYTLEYFNGKWVAYLNTIDTERIVTALKKVEYIDCVLEIDYKEKDSNDIQSISKNVRMNNKY